METGLKGTAESDGPALDDSGLDEEPEEEEESWVEPPPTPDEPEEEDPPSTPDDPEEEDPPPEEEPPPEDDCDQTSDLIYVIDRAQEALFLFDPEAVEFERVGDLDCGIFAGSPASMSVARDGVAYVRYSDNTVYAVDLETMACEETAYAAGSFGAFGMGFATESSTTWRDQLYIANATTLGLVDTETWSVGHMGSLPSQSELTGNADGELWAILPLETPAQLVRLDKDNAHIEETMLLSGMPDPYDIDIFAFATWGGNFWVFVRTYGLGQTTDVYRVSSSGSTTRVATDTGMDIVGAGVSTCAPTE